LQRRSVTFGDVLHLGTPRKAYVLFHKERRRRGATSVFLI